MGKMVQTLGLGVQRLKSECKNSRLQGWEYKDLHFKNGSATLAIGVLSGKRPTKGLFKMPQKQDTLYHFYSYHLICHPLNLIVAPGLCKNITPLLRKYNTILKNNSFYKPSLSVNCLVGWAFLINELFCQILEDIFEQLIVSSTSTCQKPSTRSPTGGCWWC